MKLSKSHEFSYGHRLQRHPGKCRHLHGHNGKIDLTIGGAVDSTTGMVQDFGNFKIVFEYFDNLFDHVVILEIGDPLIEVLVSADQKVQRIPEPPTAEILAAHCCIIASQTLHVKDCAVRFWETSDAFAYIELEEAVKLVGDSVHANTSPTR